MLEQKMKDAIEAILGKGGIASRAGKAFRQNEQQIDYARRAAQGLCRFDPADGRASINMLQAATGLGKTIGYLLPAMLYGALTGKRVAVSTNTRQLQRQIMEKDAPTVARWVAEATAVHLSVQRRVGRANYVSASNCEEVAQRLRHEGAKESGPAIDFLEELAEWAEEDDSSGLLDDFLEDRALNGLPDGVAAHHVCLNERSSKDEAVKFERDVAASKAADVLIVNHALMVMHAYRWNDLLDDQDGRPISVVVFDEADRLPDVAENLLSAGIALHRLRSLTEEVSVVFGAQSIMAPISRLYDAVMLEKPPTLNMAVVSTDSEVGRYINEASSALSQVGRMLASESSLFASGQDQERRQLAENFLDATRDLLRVRDALAAKDNEAILSWSPVRAYPQLMIGHANAGRVLSRLWSIRSSEDSDDLEPARSYLDAVLFTSATLSVPGKSIPEAFDEFSRGVGVVRHCARGTNQAIHNVCVDLMHAYQPRTFGKMRFVVPDPAAPLPTMHSEDEEGRFAQTSPEWLDYCATGVRAAQKAGGRTLVLTLSWRDTMGLKERLADLDQLIIHQRGEPLRLAVEQFKRDDMASSVLISPGAWEGVDLPGLVNNLIVTRIPFAPPARIEYDRLRIHMARQGYEKSRIDALIAGMYWNAMRRKLEQGIGRALRSPTDESTVWFLDPRFPYPSRFAELLDPLFLSAPARRRNPNLVACIPQRFVDSTFPNARVLTLGGVLHTPV